MKSSERIPYFALLVCAAFSLPIKFYLNPQAFSLLSLQYSPPSHREWAVWGFAAYQSQDTTATRKKIWLQTKRLSCVDKKLPLHIIFEL